MDILIKNQTFDYLNIVPFSNDKNISCRIKSIQKEYEQKDSEGEGQRGEAGQEFDQVLKEEVLINIDSEELRDFEVLPGNKLRVTFEICSAKLGSYDINYKVKLQNSLEKSLVIKADFVPPTIAIAQRVINTGISPLKSAHCFSF